MLSTANQLVPCPHHQMMHLQFFHHKESPYLPVSPLYEDITPSYHSSFPDSVSNLILARFPRTSGWWFGMYCTVLLSTHTARRLGAFFKWGELSAHFLDVLGPVTKVSERSGGPNCDDLSGTDFTLCFCLFSANILLASSVLDLYDKPAPSAEICFKQATLSTSYTLIMANFKDCGTSLLQTLFLLSTAFVVVGHCFHILSSIIENDFESIFKWSHLAHHCAYTARSITEIPPAPRTLKAPFTRSQLRLHLLLAARQELYLGQSWKVINSEWIWDLQVHTICYKVTV